MAGWALSSTTWQMGSRPTPRLPPPALGKATAASVSKMPNSTQPLLACGGSTPGVGGVGTSGYWVGVEDAGLFFWGDFPRIDSN